MKSFKPPSPLKEMPINHLNTTQKTSLQPSQHCFPPLDPLEVEYPESAHSSAGFLWHGSVGSSGGSLSSTGPHPLTDSATSILKPLVTWPPIGLSGDSVLNNDEAMNLVADGATIFNEHWRLAYHAKQAIAHSFVLLSLGDGSPILDATSPTAMLAEDMTLSLGAGLVEPVPWRTLEQPSMTCCFGLFPGTVTLSRYIASFDRSPSPINEYPTDVRLEKLALHQILDRLWLLQGVDDDGFEQTEQDYYFLYSQLVSDPDHDSSKGTLERDIEVLSGLLHSEIWIDFSKPEKQFVAKYFAGRVWDIPTEVFFHQILMSAELGRRICALAPCVVGGTEQLMSSLPRQVAWSVALAYRFLENITFDKFDELGADPEECYTLVPHNKLAQVSKVLDFGYALKWPDMDQIEAKMRIESETEEIWGQWSVPSWTFLSGAVLPGPIASWMLMSCLLDCHPAHRSVLAGLEEMYPQSGIQYLGTTYWYWESIVGKVLGATQDSKSVGGWIGPCLYTPDLDRLQCVRIYQKPPKERMKDRKPRSMVARSSPLGPRDASYPVDDFALVLPQYSSIVEVVQMEKLAMTNPTPCDSRFSDEYQAAVQFTIDSTAYSMWLQYNVSFIAAAGCSAGPHVLHCSYAYKAVPVDQLVHMTEWAGNCAQAHWQEAPPAVRADGDDDGTVLVVEAYGVADNAVLARAWCAQLGLSAVVGDIKNTCIACTIREAHAARVAVAILTDGYQSEAADADLGSGREHGSQSSTGNTSSYS